MAATLKKFKAGALEAIDYEKLSPRTHVLERSDMYTGSIIQKEQNEWILDVRAMKMIKTVVKVPEGLSRIFLEILTNAGDALSRYKMSADKTVVTPPIEVSMNYDRIKIKNGGFPIPVEKNAEGIYVPTMVFGELRTGSNFSSTTFRLGCGKNGFGAKLTNIFSTLFQIEICDNIRGKKYSQTWRDNMHIVEEPIIEDYTGENSTTVIFHIDLKRFGYPDGKYPDEAFHLFARYCADISVSGRFPVIFNKEKIDCTNLLDFARMFFDNEVIHDSITVVKFPIVQPKGMSKEGFKMYPETELMILDTSNMKDDSPGKGEAISIVNGIMTRDGGVHVAEAYEAIGKHVLTKINTQSKSAKLSIKDLKPNISLIMSCRLLDPMFNGQSKHKLDGPCPSVSIDDKHVQTIMKWKLLDNLKELMEFKDNKLLKVSDGKKTQYQNLKKGENANFAGTDRSRECTLMLIEGKSAKGFANVLIGYLPKGRDFYGTLPLKGKPLNTRNALKSNIKGKLQLANNTEFKDLKTMTGINEDVDYSLEENFDKLRYGQIYIMVDADVDGKHIAGLIYDLFECQYPSLLKRGYLKFFRTPILRVTGGTEKKPINEKFYSVSEYEKWVEKQKTMSGLTVKYYKGLGSISEKEAKADSKTPQHVVASIYDDKASDALCLAFDSKFSDERKKWIEEWRPQEIGIESLKEMKISSFINEEFISYPIANIERALPKFIDGLKVSQRKILWTMLQKHDGYSKSPKQVKVQGLASDTTSFTNYHHGEQSLIAASIGMVWKFVGSNNLPYLVDDGMFGTRSEGGKDCAAARYTFTRPQWWVPLVFKEVDTPLLRKQEDEGNQIEPSFFLPILPMCLINGACGIATGHSTFIPCYNPKDLCKWLKMKLSGGKVPGLKPWYQGFKGKIEFKNLKVDDLDTVDDDTEEKEEDDAEGLVIKNTGKTGDLAMISKGDFVITGPASITITELPIGRWYFDYVKWLETQRLAKNIKGYARDDDSGYSTFRLTGVKPEFRNHKSLGLIKPFSMANMVLLDENNKPKKYKSANEIMEVFFEKRFPYFQKRKDLLLKDLVEEIAKLSLKAKFIRLYLDKKILIGDKIDENVTHQQMDTHGIPHAMLGTTSLSSLTRNKVQELETKLEKLLSEKKEIEAKSVEKMWTDDIDAFLIEYNKHVKEDK
jgi:DNA topoisomerase-2